MALYRRGNLWWLRFTTPNGERIRQSTGTEKRSKAQEYHDRLKAAYWREQKLGEKPRRSWQEAVVRWLDETGHKASQADDISLFRWLDPHLGGAYLDEVTRERVERIARVRQAEGVSVATVNHTPQVIRAILRKAEREWDWLDKAPALRFLPKPAKRVRWLTPEEAERLLGLLPAQLGEMARFTLATGLREANVTGLEWAQVDLARREGWVHPDQAKARKAIPVPLNREAVLILRRQRGKHPTRVFTYRGRPVAKAGGRAWREALKRAGLTDFRWHDLRHTWASWHIQQGTPLHVLQELGGWNDIRMVQRYAHLSAEHLAKYAEIACLVGRLLRNN
jgi:integrase